MNAMFDVIAFDADDTLWHNEFVYRQAKQRFRELFSSLGEPDWIGHRLDEIENDNVALYGYGIKSFMLSMVDAASQLAGEKLTSEQMRKILDIGNNMLATRTPLFDQAEAVLTYCSQRCDLMLLTKGDTFEQSAKVQRSGLAGYFRYVEVVGDKSEATYHSLLAKHSLVAERFLMVGNSLKSDILPVIALGGQAVYIPYEDTWAHEHVEISAEVRSQFHEIEHLGLLPGLLERLSAGSPPP
ncbi:MAG: hypothetical protein JW726_09095 [Anaerolineales bacterium]|nr:hypothetical protein [Anaerolineales bacterium]